MDASVNCPGSPLLKASFRETRLPISTFRLHTAGMGGAARMRGTFLVPRGIGGLKSAAGESRRAEG